MQVKMEADLERKKGSRLGAGKVDIQRQKMEINRLAKLAQDVTKAAEKIAIKKKVLAPAVEKQSLECILTCAR